jgi:hypothetical protein
MMHACRETETERQGLTFVVIDTSNTHLKKSQTTFSFPPPASQLPLFLSAENLDRQQCGPSPRPSSNFHRLYPNPAQYSKQQSCPSLSLSLSLSLFIYQLVSSSNYNFLTIFVLFCVLIVLNPIVSTNPIALLLLLLFVCCCYNDLALLTYNDAC